MKILKTVLTTELTFQFLIEIPNKVKVKIQKMRTIPKMN